VVQAYTLARLEDVSGLLETKSLKHPQMGFRIQPQRHNSSVTPRVFTRPRAPGLCRLEPGPRTNKPKPSMAWESSTGSLVPKISAVTRDTLDTGRSSDSRIVLLVQPFPLAQGKQWAYQDFRPR
jgi:hypothetical protein